MSATPGPWELRNEFGMQGLIYPVGKPRPVAFVTGYYAGAHQSEPNARLIAAAPELLEALRKVLTALEHEHGRTRIERGFSEALAVLAKATGE